MDIFRLIEKVTIPESWPGFKDPNRLEELDDLATDAFNRATSDGYLAYVLIAHQVCDELLRLLIAHTRFAVRLMIVPSGFDVKFSSKEDDSDLEKLTTGHLIDVLEHSLEFEDKDEFLKLCRELSEIRNKLAHALGRNLDVANLKETTNKYRAKYERAEELFFQADDTFRLLYKDSKKDDSWDLILEDMLEDGLDPGAEAECRRVIELRKAAGYGVASD